MAVTEQKVEGLHVNANTGGKCGIFNVAYNVKKLNRLWFNCRENNCCHFWQHLPLLCLRVCVTYFLFLRAPGSSKTILGRPPQFCFSKPSWQQYSGRMSSETKHMKNDAVLYNELHSRQLSKRRLNSERSYSLFLYQALAKHITCWTYARASTTAHSKFFISYAVTSQGGANTAKHWELWHSAVANKQPMTTSLFCLCVHSELVHCLLQTVAVCWQHAALNEVALFGTHSSVGPTWHVGSCSALRRFTSSNSVISNVK